MFDQVTLHGTDAMHRIRNGQVRGVAKGDIVTPKGISLPSCLGLLPEQAAAQNFSA